MKDATADSQTVNRLIDEKSPYLLQHAHNPVDWYPWGEAAFEKARNEEKPIFLSVGYSTCHWCHVMERESFEDPEIAKIMNDNFVNIKVDREERPDVDRVYMTFVQATTGHGGWPMSVWMTPKLEPFFGGTYFPPHGKFGRPGFAEILKEIARLWGEDRQKLVQQGEQIVNALRQREKDGESEIALPSEDVFPRAYQQLSQTYDEKYGGFGSAPKFPHPVTFDFLLRHHLRAGRESEAGQHALEMVAETLRHMARGGIHDHLGGGFHRYSVDQYWHVPHYEKMLYDQAQLATSYIETAQATGDEFFADVARDILSYVGRDLLSDEGGFYSAEDADSLPSADAEEKREGAFYTWTRDEIRDALDEDEARVFERAYGIEEGGNAPAGSDPHGELKGQNTLIQRHSISELANQFSKEPEEIEALLESAKEKLFTAREKRPRPHLDDKILTAWNGLMISGFAKAAQYFQSNDYAKTAANAAKFIRDNLYDEKTKTLYRAWREGRGEVEGFAEDYAFLIQGLLDLYEATFDIRWLKWAETLQQKQNELFRDETGGGYFSTTGEDPSILIRMKQDHDGAEPSPNSVAASNLIRLAQFRDRPLWHEQASQTIGAFDDILNQAPVAMPQMLAAYDLFLAPKQQVVIAAAPKAENLEAMLAALHRNFYPRKIVILADETREEYDWLAQRLAFLQGIDPAPPEATAYVCENFTCQLPTTDPATMLEHLHETTD